MLKTRGGDVIGASVLGTVLDERDVLLTREEAARYLRKSSPTLERWASQGIGPAVVKLGPRGVGYRLTDLRAFAGINSGEST